MIHHIAAHCASHCTRSPHPDTDMRLSACLRPLLVPLYCGILSVASPGITSNTAGPDMTLEAAVSSEDNVNNYTMEEHSLLISDFSIKDVEKKIFIEDVLRLKLGCTLEVVDSMALQISVSWRHGKDEISSNLYTSNNTNKQWHTTYEFVVTDVNKTGDYSCVFGSDTEVYGTFSLIVPPVHSGSKTVVSYNGDFLVLKCDTLTYKPVRWLWFKVTEDEQVPVNFTLDPKRYSELSKKLNETKLRITDLAESDSGSYACKADFGEIGESKGQVEIKVLSYMVPLRIFLAIAAEVVILVTAIGVYEFISKKKQGQEDVKQDYEAMSQLKSEDSDIAEASTTRQRKVEH